jgi:RNA polymerase sigma-70 factor (ECF subfamily)
VVRDAELNEQCSRLITLIRDGEEDRLAELYDLTLGKTYALAVQITGNGADAEEVVAETYIQAWRQAARYDGTRGSPLAWLLRICRSRAIDHLRRREAADPHPDPEQLRSVHTGDDGAPNESALVGLIDEERHAEVRDAIAQLPATSRELLSLAFFRDFTHEEIAGITQLPLGTVKSRLRRAVIALRSVLTPTT